MNSHNRMSILSNAGRKDLVLSPYPHLVVEDALDVTLYEQLEASFPRDSVIVGDRSVRETWYDYPACRVIEDETVPALWRDFFRYHTSGAFFRELIDLAGDALRSLNPDLERRIGRPLADFRVAMRPGGRGDPLAPGADVSLECQFYLNYTQRPRVVRGPHVDRPSELFAALLYFRQPADESVGSDLQICQSAARLFPNDRSVRIAQLPAEVDATAVRAVRTAPYKANTLVLFLNSPRSVHAVTPRTPTPVTRRHINFCGDVPFDLFQMKLPARLALKKTLEAAPLGWRLAKHIRG